MATLALEPGVKRAGHGPSLYKGGGLSSIARLDRPPLRLRVEHRKAGGLNSLPMEHAPIALVLLALTLPFRRLGTFLRSGKVIFIGWVGGFGLIGAGVLAYEPLYAAASRDIADGAIVVLTFLVFALIGVSMGGMHSFTQNWSRSAFAFPNQPQHLVWFGRDVFGLRRLTVMLRAPFRSLFGFFVLQAATMLAVAGIVAALVYLPILVVPTIGLLPVLPLALLVSFNWPYAASAAIDVHAPPFERLREIAKGGYWSRQLAFALISLPAWLLIAGTIWAGISIAEVASETAIPFILGLGIFPMMLALAWITGFAALLYAFRQIPIAAFE